MSAVVNPSRTRISVDRYQKMVTTGVLTKHDRIELIEGEMIDMAPIGIKHSAVTARLNRLFVLRLTDRAVVSPGGPINLGAYSEPQPDLTLLKPRTDFYDQQIPEAADVLLVVEVSDSSLAFDQGEKLKLFARYGIVEYWIVDVVGKRVLTHRKPSATGYAECAEYTAPAVVAPLAFPDLSIAVTELLP